MNNEELNNRLKQLKIEDKRVFHEQEERFRLSQRDCDKVLYHTKVKKRNKKRNK